MTLKRDLCKFEIFLPELDFGLYRDCSDPEEDQDGICLYLRAKQIKNLRDSDRRLNSIN